MVNLKGSSHGYINGQRVPVNQLKQLAKLLIDIHSQHQHQHLLHDNTQRQLLDDYAGNQTLLKKVKQAFRTLKINNKQIEQTKQQIQLHKAEQQLLCYQIDELSELNLDPSHIAELELQQKQLACAEQDQQQLFSIVQQLQAPQSSSSYCQQAMQALEMVQQRHPSLNSCVQLLNEAFINLQEASNDIDHYQQQLTTTQAVCNKLIKN